MEQDDPETPPGSPPHPHPTLSDAKEPESKDPLVLACVEALMTIYTTPIPQVLTETKAVDEWMAQRHTVLQGLLRALAEASTR